jgi:hypothetical protein
MALSQISHVRPSTPLAALEIMYGVPLFDLFIQNCAKNAAIRVKPDTSWQPPAKARARVAHGRQLQHQFLAGLWQADTDEITHENVWEKNYTVQYPTKEIEMLPSGYIDAYTDGSLMGVKSGAGAFILRKSDRKRKHFIYLKGKHKAGYSISVGSNCREGCCQSPDIKQSLWGTDCLPCGQSGNPEDIGLN